MSFTIACRTAPTIIEVVLGRLEAYTEQEKVRVELVVELPGHLAVQLPQVVRHHQRGQAEQKRLHPEPGEHFSLTLTVSDPQERW